MRRTTALALAALAAALLLPGPSAANAAEGLPSCPPPSKLVTTFLPAYAREGSGIEIELVAQQSRVSSLSLTASNNQPTAVVAVPVEKARTPVVISAGPRGDLKLSVRWEQDLGSPAACVGSDDFTIPVVPPGVSVGRPIAPRLAGTFAMAGKEVAPDRGRWDHWAWTFSPRCDLFACSTRLGWPGKTVGYLLPKMNGSYELSRSYQLTGSEADCIIETIKRNHFTGEVTSRTTRRYRHTYEARIRIELMPTKWRGDDAIAFRGTAAEVWMPNERGRRKGCHLRYHYLERFTGKLR